MEQAQVPPSQRSEAVTRALPVCCVLTSQERAVWEGFLESFSRGRRRNGVSLGRKDLGGVVPAKEAAVEDTALSAVGPERRRGEAGDGSWAEERGALSSGHGLAPSDLQGEGWGGEGNSSGQEGWGLQIRERFGTTGRDLVCAGGRWHLSLQCDPPTWCPQYEQVWGTSDGFGLGCVGSEGPVSSEAQGAQESGLGLELWAGPWRWGPPPSVPTPPLQQPPHIQGPLAWPRMS